MSEHHDWSQSTQTETETSILNLYGIKPSLNPQNTKEKEILKAIESGMPDEKSLLSVFFESWELGMNNKRRGLG